MKLALPLKVKAPAKVNLSLYVGARRADGLHQLCSLFQSVSLYDQLLIEWAQDELEDTIICAGIDEANIVTTALREFRQASSWRGPPLRVTISKQIPIAAGLGGGSADAAALLRTLNLLADPQLSSAELPALAMRIGADVLSQITPGFCLVTGAGETVEPLPPPNEYGIVLIPSATGLSSTDVYCRFDGSFTDRKAGRSEFELAGLAADMHERVSLAALIEEVNDLQATVLEVRPDLVRAIESLRAAGAMAARLTGSGPTVFGLFADYEGACAALSRLNGLGAIAARPVGPQAGEPYS